MSRTKSEPELVAAARAGSQDACAELVRGSWKQAWFAALRVTGSRALADEVCQDALERAFANLDQLDARREFGAWLTRIAVNRAIDVVRSERRRGVREEGFLDRDAFEDQVPHPELIAAVQQLEPEARTLIALRFWLDYSYAQISEALAVPEGTVASRISRVLDRLRESMGDTP